MAAIEPAPPTSFVSFADAYAGPMAVFSAHATRALADSKYDKRKSGALEVEGYVKALVLEQKRSGLPCTEGVAKVCRRLAHDFVLASDPNKRKGGMIGIAAVAIGLGSEVGKYCEYLLPAVLKCFEDPEAKVRYFAIEAMFNIAKVSRQALLRPSQSRFNCIYHGLCKVFADTDAEVKHGAVLLDRQLKTIVSEAVVGEFDLDVAVQLFQGYLRVKNPFIRQLLVSWICHLDSVPDLLIVNKLPLLLDGLLDMLSDGNKSIRDSVEVCLAAFLQEIADRVKNCTPDSAAQASALLTTVVNICLHRRLDATCARVRYTCMHWLGELVHRFGKSKLQTSFYDFLKAVLDSVAEGGGGEAEQPVRLGLRLDGELVAHYCTEDGSFSEQDEENLLRVCVQYLPHHPSRQVREICLKWTALLLDKQLARGLSSKQVIDRLGVVDALVVGAINDSEDDDVVVQALAALARVARNTGDNALVLGKVLAKFRKCELEDESKLLERRGPFIIRRLCLLLSPAPVYLGLAELLLAEQPQPQRPQEDLAFVALMVQTLNVILLTSTELGELRRELKRDERTFDAVFQAWAHNPVSALALALLSGAYELAGRLVHELSQVDVTVELLVDADRLVRLLESPVFLHVRMDLLRTEAEAEEEGGFEPDLLKALFGVLMLLPQKSDAFITLNARLSAVTSMHISLGRSGGGSRKKTTATTTAAKARIDRLCGEFARIQLAQQQVRTHALARQSLLQ